MDDQNAQFPAIEKLGVAELEELSPEERTELLEAAADELTTLNDRIDETIGEAAAAMEAISSVSATEVDAFDRAVEEFATNLQRDVESLELMQQQFDEYEREVRKEARITDVSSGDAEELTEFAGSLTDALKADSTETERD